MILAQKPIEQVDLVLCEDGKTLMAYGWTGDDDDTAIASVEIDPTVDEFSTECTDGKALAESLLLANELTLRLMK
ncbi:hypothetical protein [Sinorhizobium psoraleae]|uniref:Uncharacterized protein n=1 Tax=Sinorhizobium psoraleae TaxID=520838 RepID=A0ABT4KI88_9HYPH|nr:hypothetical protein [Sinorhizobium psoraleae]MCZ4091685.1 hypothetical protein [Sinorhizobium psoraleae]